MKLGFIGGGNMASAIVGGLLNSGYTEGKSIYISDKDKKKVEIWKEYGVNISNNTDVVTSSDVVILAVKPNILPAVLNEIKSYVDNQIIVSIAAGTKIDTIEKIIGADKKIIRVMPNTPAQVRCGMAVISPNKNAKAEDINTVCGIFNAVGSAVVLEEKYINAATALHGSSPAYIYMLIDAMADSGVKYGIPKEISLMLAAKAVEGSAKMVSETKVHPSELCDRVCSPGGTTIEAVCELERLGFKATVQQAIDVCVSKAEEMSK